MIKMKIEMIMVSHNALKNSKLLYISSAALTFIRQHYDRPQQNLLIS